MQHVAVSRRDVTRALVALPATAIPSLAVAPPRAGNEGDISMNMHATIDSQYARDRRNWDRLVAAYREAKAADDRYYNDVYCVAQDELDRRAPYPNLTMRVTARDGSGYSEWVQGSKLAELVKVHHLEKFARPLLDAWEIYCVRRSEAEKDLGWEAIEEKSHELTDRHCELERQLIEMVAPDAGALALKMVILNGNVGENQDYRSAILRDARRFADAA